MKLCVSEAAFLRLANQGNVVPVYAEHVGDLETPVSSYLKLDDGRFSFLLESVSGAERLARFSFVGSHPRLLVTAAGRHMELSEFRPGRGPKVTRFETATDPLKEVERLMSRYRAVAIPKLPRFCGGLVGYLGYNVVRFLERLPAHRVDDLRVPDLMLMLADTMAIFDHAEHKLLLVANAIIDGQSPRAAYRQAVRRIAQMAARLRGPLPASRGRLAARPHPADARVRSNVTPGEFTRMVTRAKEYIRAGDIIQVVLSQRLQREIRCGSLDVYRVLRSLNPSPYMYHLRLGSLQLVGTSPEMLIRCEDGHLETRPIAGTRRRGYDEREDERLIQQLCQSPKERAEHLMLVDLGRNDLGRVAVTGSVKTPELMIVEKYSHVLHLVSSVTARLRPGLNSFDVLRATFPAGTVAGAPKVRAMEIIAQLERTQRGPYAGAIGYFSFSGNLDTCITIRTVLINGRQAYIQAGAGIVADSQPQREYDETLSKARGMLHALDIAEARFVKGGAQ